MAFKSFFGRKTKTVFIGNTTHCVCCGKEIPKDKWVGTGHVIKTGDVVMARFCNQICIRNIEKFFPLWNGSQWMEEYGLEEYKEKVEVEL